MVFRLPPSAFCSPPPTYPLTSTIPPPVDAHDVGGTPQGLSFECIDLDREGLRFATGSKDGNVVIWERNNSMAEGYGVVNFEQSLNDCSEEATKLREAEEK